MEFSFIQEAVLTEYGHEMVKNFINLAKEWKIKMKNRKIKNWKIM